MKNRVDQCAAKELERNEDGKFASEWGSGECLIPVIVDEVDGELRLAGISKRDLHRRRVCNREKNVVYVRGNKEMYDGVMSTYSAEFKKEDRDRRCHVKGENGGLIRCPEQVRDPETGRMMHRSCEDCPYYNSLDKRDYYTASFSDLSSETEEGDCAEFIPGTGDMMPGGDRYLMILEELIEHVSELNPDYGEIIRLREQGMGQKDIAEAIGKSQPSVAAYLKGLRPVVEEFLENLVI
jgi:hypothetical protein